jgi:hypothetical protein
LGDGVFAEWDRDHGSIVLTTGQGTLTQTIVLDNEVRASLSKFLLRANEEEDVADD